jgi:hypothetical protein
VATVRNIEVMSGNLTYTICILVDLVNSSSLDNILFLKYIRTCKRIGIEECRLLGCYIVWLL